MSSWSKKLNSVIVAERRFASHPNSTNAIVGRSYFIAGSLVLSTSRVNSLL